MAVVVCGEQCKQIVFDQVDKYYQQELESVMENKIQNNLGFFFTSRLITHTK